VSRPSSIGPRRLPVDVGRQSIVDGQWSISSDRVLMDQTMDTPDCGQFTDFNIISVKGARIGDVERATSILVARSTDCQEKPRD
jgi:hypothetical protein